MSLVALAGAVEDLVLVPVGEDIDQALWLRDRLEAKIGEALRDFDARGGWGVDGSLSLSSWLAAHGRLSRRDAHLEATVAVRLARLPVTAQAWADGTLSSGQVAAIVANVSSKRAGLYAGHEADMTPVLAELSVADVAAIVRNWALHAEASEDNPEGAEPTAGHGRAPGREPGRGVPVVPGPWRPALVGVAPAPPGLGHRGYFRPGRRRARPPGRRHRRPRQHRPAPGL